MNLRTKTIAKIELSIFYYILTMVFILGLSRNSDVMILKMDSFNIITLRFGYDLHRKRFLNLFYFYALFLINVILHL